MCPCILSLRQNIRLPNSRRPSATPVLNKVVIKRVRYHKRSILTSKSQEIGSGWVCITHGSIRLALASRCEDHVMPHTISFSEEIDKINDAFPVVLYCTKCDRLQLMKLERGSDKLAHRCTACGTARRSR